MPIAIIHSGHGSGWRWPSAGDDGVTQHENRRTWTRIYGGVGAGRVAPPPPILLSPALADSNMLLTWTAISNTTYRLEFNPDLNPSNWNALPGNATGASNTASKSDTLTPSNRFYRVRVLP